MKKVYFLICLFFTLSVQSQVLITEILDPADNFRQRFVEVCNRGSATVDISGWQIRRYSNGDTDFQIVTAPPSTFLAAGECVVFQHNEAETFYSCYLDNSIAINSNGNDVYELYNGTDVVDVYGVVGVDGTGEPWEFEDSRVVRHADVLTGNPTFTLSEWTIIPNSNTADGSPCVDDASALPIKLAYFVGEEENRTVNLEWKTLSEINNDYFELLHSTNGLDFTAIHTEDGFGTTVEPQTYYYTDEHPNPGVNYYKLVQYDFDGSRSEEGDIVQVNVPLDEELKIIASATELVLIIPKEGLGSITIFNMNGRALVHTQEQLIAGENSFLLPTELAKGWYVIELTVNGQQKTKKLIIQ